MPEAQSILEEKESNFKLEKGTENQNSVIRLHVLLAELYI